MSRGSFVDPTADIPDNKNVVAKILLVYEEYSEMTAVQSALLKVGFDVLGITTEYTVSENIVSFNPDVVVALGRGGKVTTLGVGRRLREMTRWTGKSVLILPAGYKPNPQDFGKVRADMLLEAPVPLTRLVQVVAKLMNMDEMQAVERLNRQTPESPKGEDEDNGISIPNLQPTSGNESVVVTGGAAAPTEKKWSWDIPKPEREKEQDLESLWKELTSDDEPQTVKGSAPEKTESVSMTFDLKDRQSPDLKDRFADETLKAPVSVPSVDKMLEEAHKTEHERVSKYARFTDKVPKFEIAQGHSKVTTRGIQKELTRSWNHGEIESQDKSRQEFTKALFRKK